MRNNKTTQNLKITSLISLGGIPGYFLLAYPLIYLIFSRRRDVADAYATVDNSALAFIVYSFICLGVGLYFLFNVYRSHFAKFIFLNTPIKWFLSYTILGLFSSLWSTDLLLTAYRSIECFAMMTLMIATLQELIKYKNINWMIQWSTLYAFIHVLISIYKYTQWTTNLSTILEGSQMTATVFFFLAWYYAKQWYVKWTIIAFSIFSGSTVALIGIALGFIGLLFGESKRKIIFTTIALIIIISATIIGGKTLLLKTIFHDKPDISIQNTTGRDKILETSINFIKKRPISGYGFFSGESEVMRKYSRFKGAINTHNSFLSSLLGIGIPGFILILSFFITMFSISHSKYIPINYKPALVGTFIIGFVQSMGNPGIGSRVYGSWMSVMYVYVLISSIYIFYRFYNPKLQKR